MGASETIGHEVTTGIAGVLGLEPRLNEPESLVLPITPYPKVCWPLWGQRKKRLPERTPIPKSSRPSVVHVAGTPDRYRAEDVLNDST